MPASAAVLPPPVELVVEPPVEPQEGPQEPLSAPDTAAEFIRLHRALLGADGLPGDRAVVEANLRAGYSHAAQISNAAAALACLTSATLRDDQSMSRALAAVALTRGPTWAVVLDEYAAARPEIAADLARLRSLEPPTRPVEPRPVLGRQITDERPGIPVIEGPPWTWPRGTTRKPEEVA